MVEETSGLRRVCLKGFHGLRAYAHLPTLGTATRATASRGVPVEYGKWTSDWKWGESQASSIIPSLTPPHIQYHKVAKWVALPWRIPKALTLTA